MYGETFSRKSCSPFAHESDVSHIKFKTISKRPLGGSSGRYMRGKIWSRVKRFIGEKSSKNVSTVRTELGSVIVYVRLCERGRKEN
eukprot:4237905-Pyramimonas_sp.AAC.1